jgi:para-aminobenzoate synthetase component 2
MIPICWRLFKRLVRETTEMILLIDNYDSFTYNLYQYLLMLNKEVLVLRNDNVDAEEVERINPELIVISPGPGGPESTGACREIVEIFKGRIPILGICLGMQVIAHVFGARIEEALEPVHGKVKSVRHLGSGLFETLPNPLNVTRYHSLIVERASMPDCLKVDSESETGEIMGLSHERLPIWGVQFHPEALLTEGGIPLLGNALKLAEAWRERS